MGHAAIRAMMKSSANKAPLLNAIVELDEKSLSGKPRYEPDVYHKRGVAPQNNES
jgi:hypothetical protein